jgi:hypothetical protein
MSTRIKIFREETQLIETRQYLSGRGIKTYSRNRTVQDGDGTPTGYDLFVLHDDDAEEARSLLEYEFGKSWGEKEE